ncbi:MAG TPA: aldehyde dehydrogenase family protein [Bradyrhizobium sp.]|nr:aldehyde dehydrogenase family protein [Bradyrhizobium sp.]
MGASFDPDAITLPSGHFIEGRYLAAQNEIELRRPSDGTPYAGCPIASEEVVDRAVSAANEALRSSGWATLRPRERTVAMQRWADLIEAETETMARLESLASTRPIAQTLSVDVPVTIEQIRFFAELSDKEGGLLAPTADCHVGMIASEPFGVVGAIVPWNVPLSSAGWKIGPALAAGNAIVLKPSELTPFSTLYLAELSVRAGLPAGLINIVLGDGTTTGSAISRHPGIGKVSFTGSTRAGSAVMEDIARTGVKPVTLELGGKSPQIVFADADLDLAADCVARSILANAGQACVAGSRLIVAESVAPAVIEAVASKMKAVRLGPTWDEATDFPPIISENQLARIEQIVQRAQASGAKILIGGFRLDRRGWYYQPTILANVTPQSEAVCQEIFGPVLTVETFRDEEEALALADHPTYGLAAGIYTRDLSRALRVTKRIQSGTVWVNRYSRSRDHILPTGGYKRSGIGKDLGREAFLANRRQKTILIDL